MPHRLYATVAARARHRCEYCLAPEAFFNLEFEVDHIIPAAREGTDEFDNLALACRSCNLRKTFAVGAVDPVTGAVSPLFDPRRQAWLDHFQLLLPEARIDGRTPIGRATAQRLGMNRPRATRARRLWLARLLRGR